jgi:Protoglobin
MTPDPSAIPGYDYGTERVSRSPVTLEELAQLKNAAGLTEEDHHHLALAGEVLADQAEDMVSAWRAVIGANEHLAKWFQKPDGQPDDRYKAAVKPRFVQWVIDTCTRPYDQAWLDYEAEIGLRHTPEKKNATDREHASVGSVALRGSFHLGHYYHRARISCPQRALARTHRTHARGLDQGSAAQRSAAEPSVYKGRAVVTVRPATIAIDTAAMIQSHREERNPTWARF